MCVFDVGVPLVKLVSFVDKDESFSLFIDWFEQVNSGVDWDIDGESKDVWLEFEIISDGTVNLCVRRRPFRRINEGESFDLPTKSKWLIESSDFLWRIIGLKGDNCFGGKILDGDTVFVWLLRFEIVCNWLSDWWTSFKRWRRGRRSNLCSCFSLTDFDSFWCDGEIEVTRTRTAWIELFETKKKREII
jgi:hypothetical protein